MSNKTQLQTNNEALDGYIARINAAKETAAGLPNAGSGGGGTTMATIGVSAGNGTVIKYIDASGNLATISNVSGSYSLPVPRLYFAFNTSYMSISASGNCSIVFQTMTQALFYATGDGYILAEGVGNDHGAGGN